MSAACIEKFPGTQRAYSVTVTQLRLKTKKLNTNENAADAVTENRHQASIVSVVYCATMNGFLIITYLFVDDAVEVVLRFLF